MQLLHIRMCNSRHNNSCNSTLQTFALLLPVLHARDATHALLRFTFIESFLNIPHRLVCLRTRVAFIIFCVWCLRFIPTPPVLDRDNIGFLTHLLLGSSKLLTFNIASIKNTNQLLMVVCKGLARSNFLLYSSLLAFY